MAGIDTRALTSLIREKGMPHGVIVNAGRRRSWTATRCSKQAKSFSGLEGLDLAKDVTSRQTYKWDEMPWAWNEGYGEEAEADLARHRDRLWRQAQHPAPAGRAGRRHHRGAGQCRLWKR